MAKNKKPHHHKPTADPKLELYLANKMKVENAKARIAGKEYGCLCMGIIALMATLAESELPKVREYMIKASEVIGKNEYLPINELIEEVNKEMGSTITNDQLVEVDPTLEKFLV